MLKYIDILRVLKNVLNIIDRKGCRKFYFREESLGFVKYIFFFKRVF